MIASKFILCYMREDPETANQHQEFFQDFKTWSRSEKTVYMKQMFSNYTVCLPSVYVLHSYLALHVGLLRESLEHGMNGDCNVRFHANVFQESNCIS